MTNLIKKIHYKSFDEEKTALVINKSTGSPNIQAMISNLAKIEKRNIFISNLLKRLLDTGKKVLLLSSRTEQLYLLHRLINSNLVSIYVGRMTKKKLTISSNKQIVLATYAMANESIQYDNFDIIISSTLLKYIDQKMRITNHSTIIDIVNEHKSLFRSSEQQIGIIQQFYVADYKCDGYASYDDIDYIDKYIITEFWDIIDTLPHEIIYQWINKGTSKVSKLWCKLWYSKPMSIKLRNDHFAVKDADILLKFKNLVTLELESEIQIGEFVKSLTMLKELRIGDNDHFDDETLCYLTNLCSLTLMRNTRVTIESLRCLTKLTDLNLDKNTTITDAMLKTLTNLTRLNVVNNKLITDNSLKHLTHLNHLTLGTNNFLVCNQIISDESIMRLTNITHLSIANCISITNKSIEKLTNITSIHLNNTNKIGYQSLKHLINLSSLCLINTNINGLELRKMTGLKSLTIKSCANITGVSIIYLTNLGSLKIDNIGVITFTEISRLTNLRNLTIHRCSRAHVKKIEQMLPNTIVQNLF